jgi:hypothetical protein
MLQLVQVRYVAIVEQMPNRPNRFKTPPKPPIESRVSKINKAIIASEHSIIEQDGRLKCTACLASVSIKALHVFMFLEHPCHPVKDTRIVPIGRKYSHPSPNLKLYAGVYICISCGSVVKNRMMSLIDPCGPPFILQQV